MGVLVDAQIVTDQLIFLLCIVINFCCKNDTKFLKPQLLSGTEKNISSCHVMQLAGNARLQDSFKHSIYPISTFKISTIA